MYKTNKDVTSDKELSELTDFIVKKCRVSAQLIKRKPETLTATETMLLEKEKDE